MKIKKLFLFLLFAFVFVCALRCVNSVQPPSFNSDTTTHAFKVLRVDTLGDLFSTVYGMDIVDENNIWAVGSFTKGTDEINGSYDSNYNAAHWDGVKWNMNRIILQGFGHPTKNYPQALTSIKVFNDSSIFVYSLYDSYAKWNGKNWFSDSSTAGPLGSMWSRSANEIYLVGPSGNAARYDGKGFTKMYTGLSNPQLLDIWGTSSNLYTVGFPMTVDQGQESVFLFSTGQTWTIIEKCNVNTQSAIPPYQYVGAMQSIFQASDGSSVWLLAYVKSWILFKVTSINPFHAEPFYNIADGFYPTGIRGNADNDLFLASSIDGQFLHYNGSTWALITPFIAQLRGRLVVKGNICVLGGGDSRGIIAVLKRQ